MFQVYLFTNNYNEMGGPKFPKYYFNFLSFLLLVNLKIYVNQYLIIDLKENPQNIHT